MKTGARSAILVIDFINDIVHKEGKTPSCASFVEENATIERANRVIRFGHQSGVPILFVKVGFSQNYLEHPANSPMFKNAKLNEALLLGEWGTNYHVALDYKESDISIVKHRVSPFYATSLEPILSSHQIDRLILTGVSTNNAVQACARDGHDRDYDVVVVEDACGAATRQDHENALYFMKRFSKILMSDQIDRVIC